jgi:hypothetical protein
VKLLLPAFLLLSACGLPNLKPEHLELINRVNSSIAASPGDNTPRGSCGSLTGRGGMASAAVTPSPVIPMGGGYGSGELRYCAVSGEGSSATVGQDGNVTISIGGTPK